MTNKNIYQLSRYRNLLLVNAAITGSHNPVRVRLLVDTGSSYTVLRLSLLQAIGYDIQHPISSVKLTTANGMIEVPIVTVSRFNCLG